jgi:hypothetical protein
MLVPKTTSTDKTSPRNWKKDIEKDHLIHARLANLFSQPIPLRFILPRHRVLGQMEESSNIFQSFHSLEVPSSKRGMQI